MTKIQTAVIALAIIAIPLGIQFATKSEIQRKLKVQEQQSAAMPQPTHNNKTSAETMTDTRSASLRDKQAAREVAKAKAAKVMQYMALGFSDNMEAIRKSRNIEARDKSTKLSKALGVEPRIAEAITNLALENTRRSVDQDAEAMKNQADGLTVVKSDKIGLFDGIDRILSAEDAQRAKDWVNEEKRSQTRKMAELLASGNLEEFQQTVPLEGEKRQKVFDIFMEESEGMILKIDNATDNGGSGEAKRAELQEVRLEKLEKILTESEMKAYRLVLEAGNEE